MYNSNLYQEVDKVNSGSIDYNSSLSVYKTLDSVFGNYSHTDHEFTKSENSDSDFLKFSTHEPFTCGCNYHKH